MWVNVDYTKIEWVKIYIRDHIYICVSIGFFQIFGQA
jgi:hypothetical protein